MPGDLFTGDRKEKMLSPLAAAEKRFVEACVDRFPLWVKTQHLTLLTLLWSPAVVVAGWLAARHSRHWLWLASACIAAQWFTDLFDGAIGRRRNAGLRRWGFYMDHFLDYVFMACVTGHYAFLAAPESRTWFLLFVPLYAGFEVNSWLEFGATGKFRITYNGLGPTEARLFFILVNAAIVLFGIGWAERALPGFLLVQGILLAVTVARTQRRIWRQDMEEKDRPANTPPG
jgi:phosphatidylglycerophosphate synthase